MLAPLDETALVAPVQSAARSKIPVVIIDSGLKGQDYVSFVATDKTRAPPGRCAPASVLPERARFVLLR